MNHAFRSISIAIFFSIYTHYIISLPRLSCDRKDRYVEYEVSIDPRSLVTRIIAVREQLAAEFVDDLKVVSDYNDQSEKIFVFTSPFISSSSSCLHLVTIYTYIMRSLSYRECSIDTQYLHHTSIKHWMKEMKKVKKIQIKMEDMTH